MVATGTAAILVVNNLRDIPTDRRAGKRTLAVILGRRATLAEYLLLVSAAYAALPVVWSAGRFSAGALLPLLSLPTAAGRIERVAARSGADLNRSLGDTAGLSFIFSLLLAAGLLLG